VKKYQEEGKKAEINESGVGGGSIEKKET